MHVRISCINRIKTHILSDGMNFIKLWYNLSLLFLFLFMSIWWKKRWELGIDHLIVLTILILHIFFVSNTDHSLGFKIYLWSLPKTWLHRGFLRIILHIILACSHLLILLAHFRLAWSAAISVVIIKNLDVHFLVLFKGWVRHIAPKIAWSSLVCYWDPWLKVKLMQKLLVLLLWLTINIYHSVSRLTFDLRILLHLAVDDLRLN